MRYLDAFQVDIQTEQGAEKASENLCCRESSDEQNRFHHNEYSVCFRGEVRFDMAERSDDIHGGVSHHPLCHDGVVAYDYDIWNSTCYRCLHSFRARRRYAEHFNRLDRAA